MSDPIDYRAMRSYRRQINKRLSNMEGRLDRLVERQRRQEAYIGQVKNLLVKEEE